MAIYAKIQQVMKAVRGVGKHSENTHAGYKFAGHEAVTEALRGHFVSLGIVRHASVTSCQLLPGGIVQVMVRVTYTDTEDCSKIELDMPAIQPAQTKSGTVTAQQIGQAVSYAVKNVEFKLFSLTGDTEADSDSLPIERSEDDYAASEEQDAARKRATAMLRDFDQARDAEMVMAINKQFKLQWGDLKSVAGLADEIVKRRTAALTRVKGAAL